MTYYSFKKTLASHEARKVCICTILMSALALTAAPALAHDKTEAHILSNTEYGTANGIDDLTGITPADSVCTTGKPSDDASKIFCFYNEGAKRFLSIGGLWGTHASINNTPFGIWMEKTGTEGQFYLNSKVDGSTTGSYMGAGTKNGVDDLWMDRGNGGTSRSVFTFEQADGYSDTNKVYRIKVTFGNKTSYVTTYPSNKERLCNITTKAYDTSDAAYKNQVWKIISKKEYYTLALANPATMKANIDFSFLVTDADFRINNTDATAWKLSGISESQANLNLGDPTMYCPFAKRGIKGTTRFNHYIEAHQRTYGKYAYCFSRKMRNFYLYQDIQVHKAGWYVLRCNGLSTQQAIEGERAPLAYLFIAQKEKGNFKGENNSSSSLNVVSADDVKEMESQADGAGIGVAFFNGKYENQAQLCVETGDDGINPPSNDNPATLRLGFYVGKGSTSVGEDEMTAVDNFKLLYAGPRRNPELILDEESTDLRYLTLAHDNYTNSVLHLNRKLNAHQWNSFILPVDLTLGQMKRTYGDAVKVAKLDRISGGTVFFVTQEPASDDDVLVKAFEPYIIYPPVTTTTSTGYTVSKFYTSQKENDNSEWLGTDYQPTNEEDKALTKSIAADHHIITMVSLDHDLLKAHMDSTKLSDDLYTWISNTSFSTGANDGDMTCYGTLAKTYDENGILEGRDDLKEDYCMRDGKLVQVPKDKPYGLKGFRCWFEIKGSKDGTSASKLSMNIDGIEDQPTSINDIHGDDALFTTRGRNIDGVFSLDGKLVRHGTSTQGLPKGIYITDGRKVVIR